MGECDVLDCQGRAQQVQCGKPPRDVDGGFSMGRQSQGNAGRCNFRVGACLQRPPDHHALVNFATLR